MGSFQERMVTLLNQPPSERTARDIEMVLPWLQKRSKVLMELDRETLKDILRHCTYQKATTDDVILKQDEIGDKFYVMMTGRVSVYIITKTDDDQPAGEGAASSPPSREKPAKETPRVETQGKTQDCETAEAAELKENNNLEPLHRTAFGKFIMCYEAGTSFGEIALMSEEATRNASIIADMDTHLLVIDRALFNRSVKATRNASIIADMDTDLLVIDRALFNRSVKATRNASIIADMDTDLVIDRALFNRSVKAKEVAAYQERVEFINHHPFFGSWTERLRRLLEMSLRKEVHPFGSVIMRQGHPAHGLVFILSGQVRVSMEPSRHESQYPTLLKPPPDPLTTANKKPAVRDKARTPKTRRTHAQIEVRRQGGYAAAEQRMRGRTVDLCSLEKNEIFGDAEMVLDLETNLATLVSTAPTEVLVLNAKNYERLVSKKHPHTVRLLLHNVCQKLAARLHSSKASQLPILSRLHATATVKQRHLEGANRTFRTKDGNQQQPSRTDEEKMLLRMFLQDRVPLIKPFVPDSLYYRQASSAKMKVLMKSPYAKLRTLNMLTTYTTLRRKVPRSIQQLKGNVKAKRELLVTRLEVDDDDEDGYDVSPRRDYLPLRPASAAPGVHASRIAVRPFASARPRSAMDMRIVPCQDGDASPWGAPSACGAGWGGGGGGGAGLGGGEEDRDTLDQNTVSEIFYQMDAMQRDKNESRLRVLCTNTARSELRTKLEREPTGGTEGESIIQGYEELYDDSFYDWETSDGNLRDLEARIASFCSPRGQPVYSRSRPTVSHLKRYEVEDPNTVPLAGGTVFVHQKPCRYSPTPAAHHPQSPHPHSVSSAASATHSHVRRFMLHRDTPSHDFFGS
ncbi:hypothetical protein ACOMHN_035201 [Nucella lapillus]